MEWFLGELVRSKQGRDCGGEYLLVKAEANHCYVADGRKAAIAKPKKKNYKHLQGTKTCSEKIQKMLLAGESPTDEQIREFLNENQAQRATKEE